MSVTKEAVQRALDEMREAEMLLDDMDYATESPRLERAMAAAARFREVLGKFEDQRTTGGRS